MDSPDVMAIQPLRGHLLLLPTFEVPTGRIMRLRGRTLEKRLSESTQLLLRVLAYLVYRLPFSEEIGGKT